MYTDKIDPKELIFLVDVTKRAEGQLVELDFEATLHNLEGGHIRNLVDRPEADFAVHGYYRQDDGAWWGYTDPKFRNIYSADLSEMEAKVKWLRPIVTKLRKMDEDPLLGPPDDLPEFMARLAKVIGMDGRCFWRLTVRGSNWSYDDNEYQAMNRPELRDWLAKRAAELMAPAHPAIQIIESIAEDLHQTEAM